MRLKEKILIIPSFLSLDGFVGSFFREQAEVMNDDYDVRFIYGFEKVYGIFSIFSFFKNIKKLIKYEVYNSKNVYYHFIFPKFSFFPSRINFEIERFFYSKIILKIQSKENWHPEFIHAHSTYTAGIIAYFVGSKYKIPYIITEHKLFLIHWFNKKMKRLGKIALENATQVLTVSHDKSRQILMHGIQVRPAFIGNLVNDELFYYKPLIKKEEFTITTIGSFSWEKDYSTFFETIKLVQKKSVKPVKVFCVGYNTWTNEDHTSSMEQMAKYYKIDNVVFVPNVPREELNEYYWNTDIFVLTSIAEGLPVSVIESLACGRPVFGTRCGGLEDVVNEENGATVPLQASQMLANKILDHIHQKIVFNSQNISHDIISKFGKEAFRKDLGKIYSSMLPHTEF